MSLKKKDELNVCIILWDLTKILDSKWKNFGCYRNWASQDLVV